MANASSDERIKYSGIPDSVRYQPNESATPWMEIAKEQLHSKIKEHQDYQSFVRQFALSFVTSKTQLPLLRSIADESVGKNVAQQNPEISKFLNSFPSKTRPDLVKRKSPGEWHMNAWCAAFVNWCLLQANIDVRGTATAATWLKNGTPIHIPKYGCIVITEPLTTTGSSTGHVAFCVEPLAHGVRLLGGNQSRAVTDKLTVSYEKVRGYRWPTTVNLLAATSNVV